MLGSSALPAFPIDVRSGLGIDVSRQGTSTVLTLNESPLASSGSGAVFVVATPTGETKLADGLVLCVRADRDFASSPALKIDRNPPQPWCDVAGQPLTRVVKERIYRVVYDGEFGQFRCIALDTVRNADMAPSPAGTLKGNAGAQTDAPADLSTSDVRSLIQVDRVDNSSDADKTLPGNPIGDAIAGKATPEMLGAALVPLSQAIDTLRAGQGGQSPVFDTLAQINASLDFPADTLAQVVNDGPNNGTYRKSAEAGAGAWTRISVATLIGLEAATRSARETVGRAPGLSEALAVTDEAGFALLRVLLDGGLATPAFDLASGNDGSFEICDQLGNVLVRFDRDGLRSGGSLDLQGARLAQRSGQDGLEIADEGGNLLARFGGKGLEIGGAIDLGAGRFEPHADNTFLVTDPHGFTAVAISPSGQMQVASLLVGSGDVSGNYSADEIAERNARALALSAAARQQIDATSAAPVWGCNHIIVDGQSLGQGNETWPAKTLSGRSDVLMLGQSTRPGGAFNATVPSPLGDNTLRAAVATVQDGTSGALLNASQQAALSPGDQSFGEEPGVAAVLFARRLFLQRLGVAAADDRKFALTNVAVGGTTVEQHQKGASLELFNRLRAMASAVKGAANAAGMSYGVAALFWLQGEYNYSAGYGGSADKASYKTKLKQYYTDFIADVCTGIAGQADAPAIITYQTGGAWALDAADLSIGEAQWELSQENQSWYLAAPSYPVTDKGGHLDANGSRWLGCQLGKVLFETVVLRRRWKPLSPLRATVRGRTVLVDFHVPCPPLQIRPVWVGSTAKTYAAAGFSVRDDNGDVPILDVSLAGDAVVKIGLGRDPVGTVNAYYGRASSEGGGNLCDSDPLVAPFSYSYTAGSGDYAAANIPDLVGKPYPLWNWCIGFKISATRN